MEKHLENSKTNNWWLIIVLMITLIPQLFSPLLSQADTGSYLNFSDTRPPLLPLILTIIRFLGDKQYFLFHVLQLLLIALAMLTLDKWLQREFRSPKYTSVIIAIILLPLLIRENYFGNVIMSESLSLPLCIFVLMSLCNLFIYRNIKHSLFFCFFISLLILVRNQFLFLYGFMPIVFIWFLYHRTPTKIFFKIAGIFLLTIMLTTLVSYSYQYTVNGEFSGTTANGSLLLVQPLFFANSTDHQIFKNNREKKIFNALYKSAYKKHLLINSLPINVNSPRKEIYIYFTKIFDPLQYANFSTLSALGLNSYQSNKIMKKIAIKLYWHHFKINIEFIVWKIVYAFGNLTALAWWLMLVLVSFISLFKNKNNKFAISSLVLLLYIFANNTIISVSEMVLYRYLIYSGIAMLILFGLLGTKAITTQPSHRG